MNRLSQNGYFYKKKKKKPLLASPLSTLQLNKIKDNLG